MAADFNGNGWIDLAVANHKVEGDHIGHSAVWWNGPEGFSAERVTRLPTSGPHGMAAISPHSIADRSAEEYYLSAPFKLPVAACVTEIGWEAETPPRTWVKAQLRFADTSGGLEESGLAGSGGGLAAGSRGRKRCRRKAPAANGFSTGWHWARRTPAARRA